MKRISNLFFLLIISMQLTQAQHQITEIQNLVPDLKYDVHGFEVVNDTEYLIESNEQSIRVSEVTGSIEVLYEEDYPEEMTIRGINGGFSTRSGFFVDDIYLYEIFQEQIRKRNLITGEIVDTFQFDEDQIRYFSNFSVSGDIFHFENNQEPNFATYNTVTKEFLELPFNRYNTYRSENTFYEGGLGSGITVYDALNKTTQKMFEDEVNFYSNTRNLIDGKQGLVFGNSESTRFINEDTTFLLKCNYDDIIFNIQIYDSQSGYLTIIEEQEEFAIEIKDSSDCSTVQSFSGTDYDYYYGIKHHNIPAINEEYLLFSYRPVFDEYMKLLLFDKVNSKFDTIHNYEVGNINETSFFRQGDHLFFIGRPPAWPVPIPQLYSINLTTKALERPPPGFVGGKPLAFGYSEIDSTRLLTYNSPSLKIYDFKDFTNTVLLGELFDERNAGLTSTRYLAIKDDQLVFQFQNQIYYYSSSSQIIPTFEADDISQLLIDNNSFKGLLNDQDTTYYFNYDIQNNILEKETLNQFIDLASYSTQRSDFIFGDFSISDKLYFDLQSMNLKAIDITGDIVSMHESHKTILFLSECSGAYCLTSFKDGIFTQLGLNYQNEPEIFSKENGEYLIVEKLNTSENQITYLKQDGSIGSQITVIGSRITTNLRGAEKGPLSTLMFYNNVTEEMEVILHRYNNFHSYKIPFIHAGVAPIIWYKSGNSLIVHSVDDEEETAGIYVCTLGKTAKKLILNEGSDWLHDLLYASQSNGLISIIIDSARGDYLVIEYNTETEELNITESPIERIRYTWYDVNPIYQISPSKYFVTFNYQFEYDKYENGELHVFDSNEATIEEGQNLNQRAQQSNPHRFLESHTHLFFVARSSSDNSYQLFSTAKEEITSVTENKQDPLNIEIYPNPSSNFLRIDQDAESLYFTDVKGRLLKTVYNHKKDQNINITNMKKGIYFVEAINNFTKSVGSFVKIE